ncbi:MAG: DUF1573 domain-containing protein [Pirellulales bacterium]|nr:DUF1573 domain-containing protein [Pirellulales bacterium]
MKTILAILLAVAFGVATGMGTALLRVQNPPWNGSPEGSATEPPLPDLPASGDPLPKLVVEQPKHDFGYMDVDDEGSHQFVFNNEGAGRLVLSRGVTSCNCTVAEFGTPGSLADEVSVLPERSTTITVRWRADGKVGPYYQTATIHTNDPKHRKVELVIVGEITEALKAIPPVVGLGEISTTETVTRQVPVYCYLDTPSLEILGHTWSRKGIADHFEVSFLPLPSDQLQEEPDAKSGCLLELTVKPGLPLGAIRQTILLRTNVESASALAVPIEGTVGRDVTIVGRGWDQDRGMLTIGSVRSGEGAQWKLFLIARGPHHKEIAFKPGTASPDLLQVELGQSSELPNGKATQTPVLITIPKESPRGNYLFGSEQGQIGQIVIQTTYPESPELRILVSFAIAD